MEASTKSKQSSENAGFQEENQLNFFEEAIVFNEQPFLIEGDKLKEILHRSIGALTFLNRYKQIKAGSGVLISKDTILTAAHNVFDKKCNSENSRFKFYLGANGVGDEYHQVEAWRYPEDFRTCSLSSRLHIDFAIMKLKKPVDFSEYLSLSLVCQECLLKDNENMMLKVFGFPCAYPSVTGEKFVRSFKGNFEALDEYGKRIKLYQYGLTREDRIVAVDAPKSKICYGISTLPGQSGCPVVLGNFIIAVHVGGDKTEFNVGRIIDESLIKKIRDWSMQLNAALFSINEENVCEHVKLRTLSLNKQIQASLKKHSLKNQQHFATTQTAKPISKLNQEERLDNSYQSLQIVDLLEYTNLLQLNLHNNKLELIDLSYCPRLAKLNLSNNQLHFVNLTSNINLIWLDLSMNQYQKLDLSFNINLIQLNLSSNKLLDIDVTSNIALVILLLHSNNLQRIDIGSNTNLTRLDLSSNQLQKLDVDSNINLTHLYLYKNKLQTLNLNFNVNLLDHNMSYNQIRKIGLNSNIKLVRLQLPSNRLKQIDVSSNINLTILSLGNNQIQKIDVSLNINLTRLVLSSNKLQKLDVTANINLQSLSLSDNKIDKINLSRNSKLISLWLYNNKLTRICLAISENVTEDTYTGTSGIFYFDFTNQQSAACKVELICEGLMIHKAIQLKNSRYKCLLEMKHTALDLNSNPIVVQNKANVIAQKWKKYYSPPWYTIFTDQKRFNKYGCKYSFQVV